MRADTDLKSEGIAERLRRHADTIEADSEACNYVSSEALAAFKESAALIERQQKEIEAMKSGLTEIAARGSADGSKLTDAERAELFAGHIVRYRAIARALLSGGSK